MASVATRTLSDVGDDELLNIALGVGERDDDSVRQRKYALGYFAMYLGLQRDEQAKALRRLLRMHYRPGNELVGDYKADMLKSDLATDTILFRFDAVTQAVNRCRRYREALLTTLTIDVPRDAGDRTRREVRPVSPETWESLLSQAQREAETGRPSRIRDLAIILLMGECFLKRGQVSALDFPGDVDFKGRRVHVRGTWRPLTDRALAALRHWVKIRPKFTGPLFTRLDRSRNAAKDRERLGPGAINVLTQALARRAGIKEPVRALALKKSALDRAVREGVGPAELQKMTGISRIDAVFAQVRRVKETTDATYPNRKRKTNSVGDCPVTLASPEGLPSVASRAKPRMRVLKPRLSEPEYDVVKALVEAWPDGLIGNQLRKNSGRGGWRGILDDLVEDEDWRAVIHFPKTTRGDKFRLVWPSSQQ
jgi:integrase